MRTPFTVVSRLRAFFVFALDLLLLLHREFGHANFRHAINLIAFIPAIVSDQLPEPLGASKNVASFCRTGLNLQTFVDGHQ